MGIMSANEFEPFRVVFVCTGNTCRSAMAEALLRHRLREWGPDACVVASAGTGGGGSPATDKAVEVLADRGIDRDFRVSHAKKLSGRFKRPGWTRRPS